MTESQLGRELGDAVRAVLAPAAGYLALVTANNPRGSAAQLLARPDVNAVLTDALAEAQALVEATVSQAWFATGAGESAAYKRLLADVSQAYDVLARLRALIRSAYGSVAQPAGRPAPGANPATEAARARGEAVQAALLAWGRQVAVRNRMTVSAAEGTGRTEALLDTAELLDDSLTKTWRARPGCCLWCARLNGVTIGLRDSFAPHLGGPIRTGGTPARKVATPAGARRFGMPEGSPIIYTHPPKLHHGDLQGPLLHPFCQCRLVISGVSGDTPAVPSVDDHGVAPAGFLTAAGVRAMPGDIYQAQMAFLRAAAHELDQVLKRLAGGSDRQR